MPAGAASAWGIRPRLRLARDRRDVLLAPTEEAVSECPLARERHETFWSQHQRINQSTDEAHGRRRHPGGSHTVLPHLIMDRRGAGRSHPTVGQDREVRPNRRDEV